MSNSDNKKSRTLSITKVIDAPAQLVWDAWTNPDHVIQWWAPLGMKIEVMEHDFKVGGKWKYTMPMPDGNLFVSEGKYLEIVPLKKIITTALCMKQRTTPKHKRRWDSITAGVQHSREWKQS
jgi:uncharacterized protein YndB with AHSA1/START domain